MFALSVTLTILLLLETVPSAIADLTHSRAGLTRLDQLTRLGVLEGRNRAIPRLLGIAFTVASAAVIIGIWAPPAGVAGAAVATVIFAWVLYRQLRHGDRGNALFAYSLFTAMALAVLVVDALRL